MIVKLLTEFLSLKGGCTGSSESTSVKYHIVGNQLKVNAKISGSSAATCGVNLHILVTVRWLSLHIDAHAYIILNRNTVKPVLSDHKK